MAEFYEGPLPHPDTLSKFECIKPGTADRIVQQFEEQGRDRRDMERHRMHLLGRDQWLQTCVALSGQVFGLAAFVGLLFLAKYAFDAGYAKEAAAMVGAVGVGVAGAFAVGRWRSKPPPSE